ncbi:MAG: gliding motility-associated C-terminal domain-containing protein [Flavobacteriales bacterium]|nr:gliding motility-associated C-terminal domain-containing protein [Flavobacteriales bacterium]
MKQLLLLLFALTTGIFVSAQTCSIQSADYVCIEELISFEVTASPGIQSVVWDMGDASTSTQQKFNHKYSSAGIKNVKVTVNLTGGGSCVATKSVTVYNLPVFKFSQDPANEYCLWKNSVCLFDSSYTIDNGTSISKRIVLWDDGAQSVRSNPPATDSICHHYDNPGVFKLTIELTTDKGCKAKKDIDIEIFKDVVPSIKVFSTDNNLLGYCDSARTEFFDVTSSDTSTVINKIYDWGDGTKVSTRSTHVQHFYQKTGSYKVSLTYEQKNGCFTTRDTVITVIVYSVDFNLSRNSYKQCFGNVFRFQQKDVLSGAWYWWYLNDTLQGFDIDQKFIDLYPDLGKKYLTLKIDNQGCVKWSAKDSIEVIGIDPRFVILNYNQCQNLDTVYFSIKDRRYGMGKINYMIDFGDDMAPQCTTSLVNNLNVDSNCNFSTDSLGKHFYVNGLCRKWSITVTDAEMGCGSRSMGGYVNVEMPKREDYKFNYTAKRSCLGNKDDYYVRFSHELCQILKVKTNLDSICGKKLFSSRFIQAYSYQYVCDRNGWVTVGFALEFGEPVIYKSYSDTSNFIVDPKRVCRDTIWYHNWFQLLNDPNARISVERQCLPTNTVPRFKDSLQHHLSFDVWDWGDGSKPDTTFYSKNDSLLIPVSHTYTKPGRYKLSHYLENQGKCFDVDTLKYDVGITSKIAFDSVLCPGVLVQLFDTTYYADSSEFFWNDKDRRRKHKELGYWDFDDGRGFSTDSSSPVISFPKQGNFTVRLALRDSTGCTDTVVQKIKVGGVYAGIKKFTKKLICDDIIQFFDSSYSDYKPPADSIVKHFWDFGDKGNPSFFKNPFQFYNTFGEYTITHSVENTKGCKDTVSISITIEGPITSFNIVGDTVGCAPFTAEFENTSVKARDYIWYFGDSAQSKLSTNMDTNVRFTYSQPGTYYIYLFGSDSVVNPNAGNALYYCKSLYPDTNLQVYTLKKIIVLPKPKVDFLVDSFQCKNREIRVSNRSDTLYDLFRWRIRNRDSVSTTNNDAILFSSDTGFVKIEFYPSYPPQAPYNLSCPDTISKFIYITYIVADFEVVKDTTSCPVFYFTNKTKGYSSIRWDLADPLSADNIQTTPNVKHTYSEEKGLFYPCLYIENEDGCKDTVCKEINVDLAMKLVIPNVFTPNNDGLNDVFDILAEGLEIYDLVIFNRWGQVVFRSQKDGLGNDDNNWNGKVDNKGKAYPEGIYFYIFNYAFKCDSILQKAEGTITLLAPGD